VILPGLQTLIVFAAVALGVSVSYLICARVASLVGGLIGRVRAFRPISRRPGEVVHQALKITGRRWDQYRTAALLFVVTLALMLTFGRRDWWSDLPNAWPFVIAIGQLALITFGLVKLTQLYRYRVRLARLLDQHLAVAQQLIEAQLRGNRVYHSVPVGDGIIDNVVVGSNGVYTVQLVPAPDRTSDAVGVKAGALSFSPTQVRRELGGYSKAVANLAKLLSERVGQNVKLKPVVVVPDCKIEPATVDEPLLVSIESCTSFIGWKDQEAFLMNDDVDAINTSLAMQGVDLQPASLRSMTASLDAQIQSP
jgi:hypothetical protein